MPKSFFVCNLKFITEKNGMGLPLNLFMVLMLTLFLTSCNLSYRTEHQIPFQLEHTFVPHNQNIIDQIPGLVFTPFDPNEVVPFAQLHQDLLLKIKVSSHPTDVSEFTLSLYPKYFSQVTYFYITQPGVIKQAGTQFRNQTDNDRYFSSQRYAFNIDRDDILSTHYVLVSSSHNRYIQTTLTDTDSYIKADAQFSHFTTMVYSIILAMVLFNFIFYLYSRSMSYLLYTFYMLASLYALLWQEGKINDIPAIAWYVLGSHSALIFLWIADLAANLFFYRFLRLKISQSWLVKLILVCVLFRTGFILTALIQYHIFNHLQYPILSQLFNLSIILSSLLAWVIILKKSIDNFPQAKYLLFAWSVLIFSVLLRIYFSQNPHPDLIWMPHSYEIAVMLEGLLLAFAMAGRTMEFRKQRDQALNKFSVAERSIYNNQLITQFQHEMQEVVRNPALSQAEVQEKTNIKFHLLLHRAMPVKNSMIYIEEKLHGICTTGLQLLDIELLECKFNHIFSIKQKNTIGQYNVITTDKQPLNFLYLPLKQQGAKIRFIFGLKHSQTIQPNLIKEFQSYCDEAYTALAQAKELHQVAMAANLDAMTDCHNRGSIEKVIKDSLRKSKRTTIAYIDLDNLKEINDNYGHPIGDQCIIQFSRLLKKTLKHHAKLGRIGGDEFLAVFADIDFELCEELLDLFMDILANNKISDTELTITSSVGLAESRLNETKASLLKKADLALYHSKNQGRNQVTVYSNNMAD